MTAEYDPEHAARARLRALEAEVWAAKRCNDPACRGCNAKTLALCAHVTEGPPVTAPKPVAPPFSPVPEAVFLARVDVAKRTGRIRTPSHEAERPRAGPEKE